MELDATTLQDLSVFHHEDDYSLFNKLNFTRTIEGREWLRKSFSQPFDSAEKIRENQEIIRIFHQNLQRWPQGISNGTIMVMIRFYDSNLDAIPAPNIFNAFTYKVFSNSDYSLLRYSLVHFADFLRGMRELLVLLQKTDIPPTLKSYLDRAEQLLNKPLLSELASRKAALPLGINEVIYYGRFIRDKFRSDALELIGIYGRLDAWYSLARAMEEFQLSFPVFEDSAQPVVESRGLYHILLKDPVPYDIEMSPSSNFIFLTGANMAGKSTFIRAVGCSVFLAHLGMGVPAVSMRLTYFDGLLSNINVADNIAKGESYFFNEVQRIRNTILKINDKRKWLVLIDELFKGTNVQDAMKCSSAVIRGLVKIRSSLFILSTHLYEIGEELKNHQNISFKYFETAVKDDQLEFSYQLQDGISNDRLGYLILKREKVVELLEQL